MKKTGGQTRITAASFIFLVLAFAMVMSMVMSGCVTIGREFPVDAVTRIQMGKTTRTEIDRLFGTPWRTGIDDGMRTWTYAHYRYSIFGDSRTRDLVVRFDEKGIVASYTFNSTYPEDAGSY
ncbi:MAG: outer membrane protein assembly factor BamE [bacterium]